MISSSSTTIAGGLAPSAWHRAIVQNTVWVNALRSTYSWLQAFITPQPSLNSMPLLGQSLTLLTTAITQPVQNASEAQHPTRVKPAKIQKSTKHEPFLPSNNLTQARGSKTLHAAPSSVTAPIPSHLNNEISLNLRKRFWPHQATTTAQTRPYQLAQIDQCVDDVRLHQWASLTTSPALLQGTPPFTGRVFGETSLGSQRRGITGDSLSLGLTSRFIENDPPKSTRERGTPRRYPGVGEGVRTQSYQHALIEQTRHLLKQSYQPLAKDTDHQPPTGHIEQEELLLARQWATTIGAQIAPLELLQRYATLPKHDKEAVNGHRQNEGTHASAISSLSPEERILPTLKAVDSISNQAASIQVPLIEQAQTMNGHRARNSVEQEAILPPQVAAQLPSLVTSQRVDIPPLPVAAATARFGARAEMLIDEDLDVLAAKIKRILDDEARRHGIDV